MCVCFFFWFLFVPFGFCVWLCLSPPLLGVVESHPWFGSVPLLSQGLISFLRGIIPGIQPLAG